VKNDWTRIDADKRRLNNNLRSSTLSVFRFQGVSCCCALTSATRISNWDCLTATKIARIGASRPIAPDLRMSTRCSCSTCLPASQIQTRDVTGVAISSVCHPCAVFADLSKNYLKQTPVVVGPGIKTGMSIRTDQPSEVGADLIVNAVAARELYGTPVIVIGFGTATTFSAVSAQGDFVGVAIAPGVETGAEALFRFAAKLPQVELTRPPHAIGKKHGSFDAGGTRVWICGLGRGVVKRMRAELEAKSASSQPGGWRNRSPPRRISSKLSSRI